MPEWHDRDQRQASARAEFERIMTSESPTPMGAYIETGVIGYVFGEMWQRGVLTARDRRFITLSCVGAADAGTPIDTHVWAALNSGDLTYAEFDEFVLFFGTQLGWPKASVLSMQGMVSAFRLAEERDQPLEEHDFELWADPIDDEARRRRGEAAYLEVHGAPSPSDATAFRGRAYLDFLYGEIWTRTKHLTRRDRRIVSICCAAAAGVDDEVSEHLRAALQTEELTYEELQELVVHFAVYMGWLLGRHLDDLLVTAAEGVGNEGP
ncbi:carboxymuconolactone decarboxylase family protein [Aquihabitans sp. McL0605]|uniref:carboxymuconolactone decarboxylase family protein n=1 Tax=Aquihabitans sp. McL0605 TaxID=3415671 RepID=UPI003CF53E3C